MKTILLLSVLCVFSCGCRPVPDPATEKRISALESIATNLGAHVPPSPADLVHGPYTNFNTIAADLALLHAQIAGAQKLEELSYHDFTNESDLTAQELDALGKSLRYLSEAEKASGRTISNQQAEIDILLRRAGLK